MKLTAKAPGKWWLGDYLPIGKAYFQVTDSKFLDLLLLFFFTDWDPMGFITMKNHHLRENMFGGLLFLLHRGQQANLR